MSKNKFKGDSTKLIHEGELDTHSSQSVVSPIFQTSTFYFNNISQLEEWSKGEKDHYIYTRFDNPSFRTVEKKMAALENTDDSIVVSSGLSAVAVIIAGLVKEGEEILSLANIYGGTYSFFSTMLPRWGIKVNYFTLKDVKSIKKLINKKTILIFIETPTNPLIEIADISLFAEIAKENNIILVVDNTFATPINQKPADLGADIIIHSATKYLGGHSDLVGGFVCSPSKYLKKLRDSRKMLGCCLNPITCYLLSRGMKTLELRVQKQNKNTEKIAKFLHTHPEVNRVFYPGVGDNEYGKIAKKQMKGYGGVLSFEVNGGMDKTRKIVNRLSIFRNAPSLGGVDSMCLVPVLTSHKDLTEDEKKKVGITDGIIRLSVGVEDIDDLIFDLKQALD